jgi:hypothetical protein
VRKEKAGATRTGFVLHIFAAVAKRIVDFSGNGKSDLADISGNVVTVLPGNGDGTFAGVLTFTPDQSPFALAIADLNLDGKPDIVVANQGSNDVTVMLNASVP